MNYLIRNAVAIHAEDNPTARDIRIQDGLITELGRGLAPTAEQPETIIDASGCVIWPGLVNTHHHLAQSIMKGVPAGLNQGLGEWLSSVPYRFWPKVTPELMYHAARLGLYELIRSGATTCADHHYLYHATTSPELEEAVWQAADELGIRLVLCRGSATETGSHEGMIEHRIEPETIDQVIDRLDATRKKHHQEGAGAMKKLVVATTSPELEEAVWQAADELGIRLVLCRGSATETGSHEGMIEHRIEPETIDQVIDRLDATRKKHHQEGAGAMKKLVVAPTSLIHSSTPDGLRAQAHWAREHGLRMHSHLLEVAYDEVQAREKYHQSAIDYAEACDWLGPDVWYAHLVHSDLHAIDRLAATGTGIAHCPTSNCRLGSGIAPVVAMEKAGVPVSLAVDGSASAESGSMLQELNLAWLIHRAAHGPDVTTLEQVLDWGTRGGADLLGLQETGSLAVGKQADLVLYDIDQPRFAGVHSQLLAPLMCGEPVHVKHSFVQGRCLMEDGLVTGLDERELTRKVQEGVARMLADA